ncbi:MAG: hypothetical protein WB661_00450 [Candidatus Bathyarchaeia archaeon]
MNDDSNMKIRIGVAVAASTAVALLAWFWASTHLPFPPPFPMQLPRPPPEGIPGDIGLYYILNTVFSTVNAALLVFLLALYAEIYVKRKVEFTLWLVIFCSVLLLDALTSNPILQWAFGFRPSGLGPFAMLPDVFTSIALAILLYLTLKY